MKEIRNKEEFEAILMSSFSCSDIRNDRARSYDGQPHTSYGDRGKQVLSGITMRDIQDCFVMAYLQATKRSDVVESGEWREYMVYDEVFEDDGRPYDLDPIAIAQNMTCNIEKMMGIYPNVPGLVKEEKE